MAQFHAHISISTILGIIYAFLGVYFLDVYPELAILSLVLCSLAGLLPNIDEPGSFSARELAGILAAVTPLTLFEYFPFLRSGGLPRVALIVILSYLLARVVIIRGLQKFTTHRGVLHSVPAAILAFELVYLFFGGDVYWADKTFLALAAFLGYSSHLIMDASTNVDIVGSAMGKGKKGKPALSLAGNTPFSSVLMYGLVIYLGYVVHKDLYPKANEFYQKYKAQNEEQASK